MRAYYNNGFSFRACLEPQFMAPDEVYFEAIPTSEELAVAFPQYNAVVAELAATEYQRLRAAEYPSYADQFDLLFHGGIDAWKATIQAVKDKYPKP
jgi:hypothetical protein